MEKMRITMTKTVSGSEDGIRVKRYMAGHTYDVGRDLGQAFIKSECAKSASEKAQEPTGGTQKRAKGPAENK